MCAEKPQRCEAIARREARDQNENDEELSSQALRLEGIYTSGASAEVVQDCVLSGEVVSVNQQSLKMRVDSTRWSTASLQTVI